MNIDLIPTGSNPPHELNVIIEVPMGGEPVKYEFDKKSGALFVGDTLAPLLPNVSDDQHVWAVHVELKPIRNVFAENGRGKRPEALAVFDLKIERLLHVRRPGIAENRPSAQRTRAKFHSALKPTYRFLGSERLCGDFDHFLMVD